MRHGEMSPNTYVEFVKIFLNTIRSERLNALHFTPNVSVSFKLTPANCYTVFSAVGFEVLADFSSVITFALCLVSTTTGSFVVIFCYISSLLVVCTLPSSALSTSFMTTLSVLVAFEAIKFTPGFNYITIVLRLTHRRFLAC